ncbi:TnsA endonuclease N-terminal domain-containing protein [Paenibacillus sp. N3.4]|uniref:TnsA endonuclease N-terminal domain-containing protein n=1 Tax=Paenibacillus sp. N3.4 TaxID=2603222 RepID=UPI0011C90761|nr:TnsA endonuclease N-terminal domain-containing protein [Paenibacillus sp. N3.4]TXK79841.1 hypothetical protein FU659_19340 [Paenibacillus sp. N3.4]
MVLSWSDSVIDIREQYPLTPIERSIEIAEKLNIKHANKDNEPIITTTDFMITIETGKGLEDIVRTVKVPSDLTPRTLELFQIEKLFSKSKESIGEFFILSINYRPNEGKLFSSDWTRRAGSTSTLSDKHCSKSCSASGPYTTPSRSTLLIINGRMIKSQ